jgi:hypothetical protein
MKPAPKATEEQTEMLIMTPRGGRFKVTQRSGARNLDTGHHYPDKLLKSVPSRSARTEWREANADIETPDKQGHNFTQACVEARAEALVDLRAPKGLTKAELNERMEKTKFGDVTRGTHLRVDTCMTCQSARDAGQTALDDARPKDKAPDVNDLSLFPKLG